MLAREVDRLERLGVVQSERDGALRYVELDHASPATAPLVALALNAFGPPGAIEAELAQLLKISRAVIYGSWAARGAGESGALPHDLDVLVVGSITRDDLFDLAERLTHRLGIETNVRAVSESDWERGDDPFIKAVLKRPMVEVVSRHGEP